MKIRRKISLLVMAIMSFISVLSLTSCGGLKQHEEAFFVKQNCARLEVDVLQVVQHNYQKVADKATFAGYQ